MISLDTNVLSALMQAVPARPVVEWLDRQPVDAIWLTSVTVFEAGFGIGPLPRGRRPLRGARLATRNVRDFGDLGVGAVNPWDGP